MIMILMMSIHHDLNFHADQEDHHLGKDEIDDHYWGNAHPPITAQTL